MYNNPQAIAGITGIVMGRIGWDELHARRISEKIVSNLVRATIRPIDEDSIKNRMRIAEEVVSALRRMYPVR